MVTVADIQKDLPDWPDDVIEQWLLPRIGLVFCPRGRSRPFRKR
jgi:hypothetical protein